MRNGAGKRSSRGLHGSHRVLKRAESGCASPAMALCSGVRPATPHTETAFPAPAHSRSNSLHGRCVTLKRSSFQSCRRTPPQPSAGRRGHPRDRVSARAGEDAGASGTECHPTGRKRGFAASERQRRSSTARLVL